METADLFIPHDMLQLLNKRFIGLFYWKQGSFSHIFHGTDRASNQRRAIKIVCTDIFTTDDTPTWVLDHIQADAYRAKGIDFQRVVQLYDIITGRTSIAFICEYMESGTIDDFIRNPKGHYATEEFFTKLWMDLLTGCAEMEVAGLCCRSLSAQHVLVNDGDDVCFKISDLGMTKHFACIFRWANNQRQFVQKSSLISKSIAGIVLKLGLAVSKIVPETSRLRSVVLATRVLRGDYPLATLMVLVAKHLRLPHVPSDWINYIKVQQANRTAAVRPLLFSILSKKRNSVCQEPWTTEDFLAELPDVPIPELFMENPDHPKVELHPLWEDAIRTASLEYPKSI